jgi:hypothetical protein
MRLRQILRDSKTETPRGCAATRVFSVSQIAVSQSINFLQSASDPELTSSKYNDGTLRATCLVDSDAGHSRGGNGHAREERKVDGTLRSSRQ